jgi:hypothetical protein
MERLRGFGAHTGADTNAAILVISMERAGRDLVWPHAVCFRISTNRQRFLLLTAN